MATCSDPDFLNCYIIDYLTADPSTGDVAADSATDGENKDGIRSVVERAAESLIAEKQMEMEAQITKDPSVLPSGEPTPASSPIPSKKTPVKVFEEPRKDDGPSARNTMDPAALPPILESSPPARRPSPVNSQRKKITSPKVEEAWIQSPMIYSPGTVNFSIMDISTPQSVDSPLAPADKSQLMFIVQIERPAMEDQAGSEGGGYVITRTYADFEVFHAIISARHSRRVARTNLRLPLDPIRSWLKIGGTPQAASNTYDPDTICRSLERYIHTVVQDPELGRDQLILAFLRKERRSSGNSDTADISFADEYMDEVSAYAALPSVPSSPVTNGSPQSSVGKAMSMLARAPSLAVKSVMPETNGADTSDLVASPTQEQTRRWFKRRSSRREGSVSSIRSSASSINNTDDEHVIDEYVREISAAETTPPASMAAEDEEEEKKQQQQQQQSNHTHTNGAAVVITKPLSSLDIELLIETTFALVVEIFDLTTANNKAWMRRTMLNLLREVVRRSYTEIIAEQYGTYIQEYLSPEALVGICDMVAEKFWPNGELAPSHPERTAEEKETSRLQARQLLMASAVPSAVRQLVGDQNCSAAMDRLWTRLQDQALNRVLILQLLERVMRPVFG